MSYSELGINLGNLQAYIMLLPVLRMVGFTLPPADEIYHYMNDNQLQAFLDIVAIEIDRHFAENFTSQELDSFNCPYFRFLAKDLQDISTTLPDGLFHLFLNKILVFKQSGGDGDGDGLNLKKYNKYTTAEFNTANKIMRGGELDAAVMATMNGKLDEEIIADLLQLWKSGNEEGKKEVSQYLTHLGEDEKMYPRLTKIRKALGISNAPSSAASASSAASSANPVSGAAHLPGAPAPPKANGTVSLQTKISSSLLNYLDPNVSPQQKNSIVDTLVKIGEERSVGIMEYSSSLGKKISNITGGQVIFVGNNGSQQFMDLQSVLQIVGSRRVNARRRFDNQNRSAYFLGHIRAQEQFFIKLQEEVNQNQGKNIINALKNFFIQFKPSMVDANGFSTALLAYKEKIKEKKKNIITKYSMYNGSKYVKNANINKRIEAVKFYFNLRRGVFGGVGALTSLSGALFHLNRRGYGSRLAQITGLSTPPPPPQEPTKAIRPQRFQYESGMQQQCSINERPILKPGAGSLNYGMVSTGGTPSRTEEQTTCIQGFFTESCTTKTVTIPEVPPGERPRTSQEAGGALPQNPATDLQCLRIECAEGTVWNNKNDQCEARACGAEQAFIQTGIDPVTLNGIGQCSAQKASREGEELSWGQFAYSWFGETKGKRIPCDQAGPTNLQCWSSWAQNKQIDIGRGVGSALGYTLEVGGAGIQFAANAVGLTGDFAITAALGHGTYRSVQWTHRGWDEFNTDMSQIEEMEAFITEMNNIKTEIDEQIEIATFEYMVAQFFKYIIPQIQELELGFTTVITGVKNGQPIREKFKAGTIEEAEANQRVLEYLSTMISIDKMEELWNKLKLETEFQEEVQEEFRETSKGLLTTNATQAQAKVSEAYAGKFTKADITSKDWFELFLPYFMNMILAELHKVDPKAEVRGSTFIERMKRSIAYDIKEKSNTKALEKLRTLEAQLKESITTSKDSAFMGILNKYETIAKGRGADQITSDFSYVVSCFERAGQSVKAMQENAAAVAALQRQKEEQDKQIAAQVKAQVEAQVAAASRPLQEQVKAFKNAATRAEAALAAQGAQAALAARAQTTRTPLGRLSPLAPLAPLAPAAPAPAAPAAPAPAAAAAAPAATAAAPAAAAPNNSTRGSQLRGRESEGGRRLPRGKTQKHRRRNSRKTRKSRKYRV